MRKWFLAFLLIPLLPITASAQMRGPRISDASQVTCVANWERRFLLISPGYWEMVMNDGDRLIFSEAKRSNRSIYLVNTANQRLKSKINLSRGRIKYTIPGQESDPLFFPIQSYNINGRGC